jgi:AbiV family abortive infection protein
MNVNVLKQNELILLFDASINNALQLFNSATVIFKENDIKHISLGLAELALEELGKSYTCLAYYSFGGIDDRDSVAIWKNFWKDWKNHTVKAHRAFFYEFFCLWRIEIEDSSKFAPTSRKTIPTEKEISFYIDFDMNDRKIINPFQNIDVNETVNRVTSVIGPLNAALAVQKLIRDNNNEYTTAISDYALITITENVYQQDVEAVLAKMKKNLRNYDKALYDIHELFTTKHNE